MNLQLTSDQAVFGVKCVELRGVLCNVKGEINGVLGICGQQATY